MNVFYVVKKGYQPAKSKMEVIDDGAADASLSSSSSSCGEDLGPQVRLQFDKLALVLRETNQNLHTFEFMLNQYKKMALISPIQHQRGDQPQEPVLEQLKLLSEAVGRIHGQESDRSEAREEVKSLHRKILELEGSLKEKTEECAALSQENNILKNLLEIEKVARNEVEAKLESEREAAKVVARDITRYVDNMKKLEMRNEQLIREKERSKDDTDNFSDLCRTCLERSSVEETARAVGDTVKEVEESAAIFKNEFIQERKMRLQIEEEHSKCRSQVHELERQLAELKLGLFNVQEELEKTTEDPSLKIKLAHLKAERNALKSELVKANEEAEECREELRSSQDSLSRLRSKSKIMLHRYRAKKQSLTSMTLKVAKIQKWLLELRVMCQTKEDSNRKILDHLGCQIEISARLLAAYLKVPLEKEDFLPLSNPSKGLSGWFCDVQALASWTHSQISGLGVRLWTGKESMHLTEDRDTISELSHTLTHDDVNGKKKAHSWAEEHEVIDKSQKEQLNDILDFIESHSLMEAQ